MPLKSVATFTNSFGWFQSNHFNIKRIDPCEIREKQLKNLSIHEKNKLLEKSINNHIFSLIFSGAL